MEVQKLSLDKNFMHKTSADTNKQVCKCNRM